MDLRRIQSAGRPPVDLLLLAATLLLVGLGLVMVFSSSAFLAQDQFKDSLHYFKRQSQFAALGLFAMALISRFNYRNYVKLVYPILFLTAILLALVLVPGVGVKMGGAVRWLPLWHFHLQPSEIAKVAIVVYISYSLTKRREKTKGFVSSVLNHLLIPFAMACLILLEPDFGTTVLLLGISLLMLFVAGSPWKYLIGLGLALLPALAAMFLVFPHAAKRILAWMQQILAMWSGEENYELFCYQVRESLYSFGSGRISGLGLGDGTMKLFFLPQSHNDFILATLGQELGFVGTCTLFLLFALFAWRGFTVALKVPDTFGSYLAFGLTSVLVAQFLMNVGVVLGVLPPKGIALPFLSYGGSALIMTLVMAGILLNISRYAVGRSNQRKED